MVWVIDISEILINESVDIHATVEWHSIVWGLLDADAHWDKIHTHTHTTHTHTHTHTHTQNTHTHTHTLLLFFHKVTL